jgi:hypothetical protein
MIADLNMAQSLHPWWELNKTHKEGRKEVAAFDWRVNPERAFDRW